MPAECGQLSPNSTEFPWIAGVYRKITDPPYLEWQNGASLISNTVVLTAGHWFYLPMQPTPKDSIQKPENLAVAVGKLTRPWQPVEGITQKSDVKEIHLSPRFSQRGRGAIPYFADDIAILIVTKPFRFTENVRPICLNFEYEFEQKQFQKGNKGLAMGWKPNTDDLIIKDLYFVPQYECVESNDHDEFYSNSKLFTLALSDKVCLKAKTNNSVPCHGDSGIGLVFPDDNSTQYYLLGVFSAPLNYQKTCQTNNFYGFTSIVRHESFIRRYWNESALDVFIPPDTGKCELPPYPEFGTYAINVTRMNQGDAGEVYVLVALTYTCREGYGVMGINTASCFNGFWPEAFPTCIQCGRVEPQGISIVIGGTPAKVAQLPWYTAVYIKDKTPYQLTCGGSLISNNIVLAGAACFWRNPGKLLPASKFAVAVGKKYRPWSDPNDEKDGHVQKSDVKEIHIPPTYQGAIARYRDDIAVVILTNAFEYNTNIRPICLNFDTNLDREQLQEGKKGKVASWCDLTNSLSVAELSYVSTENCKTNSVPSIRPIYTVPDKMCASSDPFNTVCQGDSGNGLAFSTMDKGAERFYLRGIVSVAPATKDGSILQNGTTIFGLTHILKHEAFINQYLSES